MQNFCVLRQRVLTATALFAASVVTLGCGSVSVSPVAAPAPGSTFAVKVYAGQQPVSGASLTLYAAGNTGNGVAPIDLSEAHTLSTSSTGEANIPEDYTCPGATTQVYLRAQGGTSAAAGGTENQALEFVAALGDCDNLSAKTGVVVNEASTVAATWALAPFFGTDAQVGSSAGNAPGLRNAFSLAANLVNTSTGVSPGAGLPANAALETSKLNTLADALAACAGSAAGAGCSPLFSAATVGATAPGNTLDAALAIVRNPASHVSEVFAAASSLTLFQPRLSSAPHDWTLSVTYGNCSSGCGGLSTPGDIAVDSTGSVWVANYFGGAVSRFSPVGTPAAASGFAGAGLSESYGIAVDPQGNVWVTNQQSVTAADNHHDGSLSEFSSTSAELSGSGFTSGGLYYPKAVAADTDGSIWAADYGSSSATLLANDGTAISGANGYAVSQLPFAEAVAIDGNHNAWFAVQAAAVRVNALGAVSPFPCCSDPEGIAVDRAGNIWIADYGGFSIVELSNSGTMLQTISTVAQSAAPVGIATDGVGSVWTANYFGNSLINIQASMPPAVLGQDAPLNEPYGIAVDASGGLWVSNAGASTLTQFVGLASPVRTPLLGPPTQP